MDSKGVVQTNHLDDVGIGDPAALCDLLAKVLQMILVYSALRQPSVFPTGGSTGIQSKEDHAIFDNVVYRRVVSGIVMDAVQ